MAKKMTIKVLGCLLTVMILMNAIPVSALAVNDNDNTTDLSNSLNVLNETPLRNVFMNNSKGCSNQSINETSKTHFYQESSPNVIVLAQGKEVRFQGEILVDLLWISLYSFDVKIDKVLDDPTGNLQKGETVNVVGHRGGPAQVDDVTVGDKVEVFGEYRGYVGTYEQIYLSDFGESSSDHYVKKIEKKKPDLIIKDISWSPSSPDKGDTITFTVKIKNQGSGSAGSSTVKYYIDGSYVGSDSVSTLSAGSTSTETFTWTASKCGDVKVKAVADANNDVYECGGKNNDRTETVSIKCPTLKPDLIIKDISWSPSSPDKGDTITFTVKIKNQGSRSAGSSTVKYYIDGSYVGSDSVSKLSAGSTSTETFTWTASKCGNVKVKAVADANNDVYECGGKNNDRTETVSIKCPTLKPDLIITDISWSPSNPDDGDIIAFSVKIKNQGSGSAGSSIVKYYVDGSYVDYDSVPALSAGSTSTQTFMWTANKCGNVQVKAVADVNNAVSESNEGNNDGTETINVICGEKPAPEIIKVTYPTTCVKEDEYTTISVTVKNNGGASSEGYISVSFPHDEHVSGVSGTGNGYNKLYPKGSLIWNSNNQQMGSVDPLVELLETNWQKGQQETITMTVKPNSGSNEIVFFVRAALKNADGTYERDPMYSGYTDQQGWYVKKYAIDVCPKEACVVIDDDTCVGYKVYVDDVYQLTEGVGETLDGSCAVYVAEGTHTIEIRDNGRYTSITRNFEGTYTWNSMPDNWCKGNTAVKFRGVVVKETHPISFYNYKVKIEKILEDPSGVLSPGDEVWVWAHADGPAKVDSVSIDDKVEVCGIYDGEPHREVKLETGEHYLRALKVSVIIDDDTCVGYEVLVDGTYKLTDSDGDGYCSFSVTEGTHTIEIRDNGRHTSITRNFKGTYTWNSMPDNWCKGNAAVKFRGAIVKKTHPISFYNYKVKIEEILEDPSGVLSPGDEVWVWAHADGPALVESVSIDDKVEVCGIYDGELHREVKLETAEHYHKNLEKQEIKFKGTAIDYFERLGAWWWYVTVDEIISGPPELLRGHTIKVYLASVNPSQYPSGYVDPNIKPEDKVEIYGWYQGYDIVSLLGSADYYIKLSDLNPKLCTSPDILSHDFGTVPKGQERSWQFDITNCGSKELKWSVSSGEPWIVGYPLSESTTPETDRVTITIDTRSLDPGAHTGQITIDSNGGRKTGTITVTIPEQTGPKLCTNPDPLSHDFGTVSKDKEISWNFDVTNCGSDTLHWSIISLDPSWIMGDPSWIMGNVKWESTTTETDTATITINTGELSCGKHEGHFLIVSNGGEKKGTIIVEVSTLPSEPKLCTSPDLPSHDFGTVPKDQERSWNFDITNCGTKELEWLVSCDQPWIKGYPPSGLTTTETDSVTITIDTSELDPGATHEGHVTVISNGGEKKGTITVAIPPEQEGPILCTSPDPPSHDFGIVPPYQRRSWNFDVTNCGSDTLHWSIVSLDSWISSLDVIPSSTKPGETDTARISIDTHELRLGRQYEGHFLIVSNSGQKEGTISVEVNIPPPEPKLCISPDPQSHDFGIVPKDQTRSWNFDITNCGSGGTLEWSLSSCDSDWIEVKPTSGSTTTTDKVTVTIDTYKLSEGRTYTGQITVTSNDESKTGTITVEVIEVKTGSLTVTIEPDDVQSNAKWKLTSEPETDWHSRGDTISNLPVDTYTIEFREVTGWTKPSPIEIGLNEGYNSRSGRYTRETGSLTVTIYPPKVRSDARWKLTSEPDTNGHSSGETITNIPIGSHTIQFNEVSSWIKPSDKSITINEGSNSQSGTYTQKSGSLTVTIYPSKVRSDARWRLTSGEDTNWHTPSDTINIPVGSYTLEFNDVSDWNKPSDKQITIMEGSTSEDGTYTQKVGSLIVTIYPPKVRSDARWRLTSGSDTGWYSSVKMISDIPVGSYTIEFKAVSDWIKPDNIETTIEEVSNSELGTYTNLEAISAEFDMIYNYPYPRDDYEPGDHIKPTVCVENTGDSSHDFFVSIHLDRWDDQNRIWEEDKDRIIVWPDPIPIERNDVNCVDFDWEIPKDMPNGFYRVKYVLWATAEYDYILDIEEEGYGAFWVVNLNFARAALARARSEYLLLIDESCMSCICPNCGYETTTDAACFGKDPDDKTETKCRGGDACKCPSCGACLVVDMEYWENKEKDRLAQFLDEYYKEIIEVIEGVETPYGSLFNAIEIGYDAATGQHSIQKMVETIDNYGEDVRKLIAAETFITAYKKDYVSNKYIHMSDYIKEYSDLCLEEAEEWENCDEEKLKSILEKEAECNGRIEGFCVKYKELMDNLFGGGPEAHKILDNTTESDLTYIAHLNKTLNGETDLLVYQEGFVLPDSWLSPP